LDTRLTTLLCKKLNGLQTNLAESSKEGHGSKSATLPVIDDDDDDEVNRHLVYKRYSYPCNRP
jgi:hypothetical protein